MEKNCPWIIYLILLLILLQYNLRAWGRAWSEEQRNSCNILVFQSKRCENFATGIPFSKTHTSTNCLFSLALAYFGGFFRPALWKKQNPPRLSSQKFMNFSKHLFFLETAAVLMFAFIFINFLVTGISEMYPEKLFRLFSKYPQRQSRCLAEFEMRFWLA